jgi:hypothetical protein
MIGWAMIIVAWATVLNLACSSSGQFSGESSSISSSENQTIPSTTKPPNPISQTTSSASIPITKGSFTVWADPADPRPGQRYELHLEVSVSDSVGAYHCRDLTGFVSGTDRFYLSIPDYCRGGNFFVGKRPAAIKGKSVYHYRFHIPGAAASVRDTIEVQSKVLNEHQSIQVSF